MDITFSASVILCSIILIALNFLIKKPDAPKVIRIMLSYVFYINLRALVRQLHYGGRCIVDVADTLSASRNHNWAYYPHCRARCAGLAIASQLSRFASGNRPLLRSIVAWLAALPAGHAPAPAIAGSSTARVGESRVASGLYCPKLACSPAHPPVTHTINLPRLPPTKPGNEKG